MSWLVSFTDIELIEFNWNFHELCCRYSSLAANRLQLLDGILRTTD